MAKRLRMAMQIAEARNSIHHARCAHRTCGEEFTTEFQQQRTCRACLDKRLRSPRHKRGECKVDQPLVW